MDLPPLPPYSTTTATTMAAPPTSAAVTTQQCFPDSNNGSPRARPSDNWDEPLPPVPGAKLRVMCSYGGHIIPRPHDKSLCYVGGDTRMVVIDRHSTLSSLSSRLTRSLLGGRHFSLKYQLPNEDLDSLISVTTDEDLENMVEEYDRITATSPGKPARLRLFLFFAKPETATSMGSLLDDAKSETWFVDALNGAALLPRGLSDSAVTDCLLDNDGDGRNGSTTDAESNNESLGNNSKQVVSNSNVQDVQSTFPDSPLMETSSSFGSSSSSPSMSNLPPIRVRVESNGARLQDQMVGLDDHFSNMSMAPPPPLPTYITTQAAPPPSGPTSAAVNPGEQGGRIVSDEDRSDHGAPTGFRKPPLPLQPVQRRFIDPYNLPSPDSKHGGGFNLHSPDSVTSDTSIASANSLSKNAQVNQEQNHPATIDNRESASPIQHKGSGSDPNSQFQMQQQQVHDSSSYMLPPQQQQQQQQQYVYANPHFIHHPQTGQVQMSSYYQMYAPPPPPPNQQHPHPQMDQQYPVYVIPVNQNGQVAQPYNITMNQSNTGDATVGAPSRPLTTQNPSMVAPSVVYKDYPPNVANMTNPELGSNMYKQVQVQVPNNQYQSQYVGVHQMHHQSQSIAPSGNNNNANYGYEYSHPTQEQVYYTQHPPHQYQTMTPATSAGLLSQASGQSSNESAGQ